MKVKVISILEDNYMYLVIEEKSKQAVAVDPAVPHRVRFLLISGENIISGPKGMNGDVFTRKR